ncbi:peptide ABC transporter substrate-binding protein [Salipiger sp. CCB-MM3]|uniref:ABC transporter substrate-binding protein n=1 Tax=Salipiger sp. CCB-MM3 TaxID=1792508 RepID=UPI00080AB971|nr:ABC transporter substrate-binding protein [Salipiger sp. CCB-MM3]ANT60846.1 peptide ABC transporter substrate-binding protein [Salipiger sp. CCB-MM3]
MKNHMNRRGFLATTGAAGALTFLGPKVLRAQDNGTLRFGLSTYPPSFDVWASNGTSAGTIKVLCHRGLLSYDKEGLIRSELAESWDVAEDGTWTFKLRDAKWHDGSPVTAEDVAWTVTEAQKPDSAAYLQASLATITSVETPDEKTVVMKTSEPQAVLPEWFANYNMSIMKKGSERDSLMGAGPFKLVSTDRGVSVTVEANPDYYKEGLPKVSTIEAIVYADENLRVAALEAGDVDIVEYVPWQAMEQVAENDALKLDTTFGPFMYLTFNASKPPFDNPLVRRAMGHAIKREDIAAAAFYERGAPLEHLPLPDASEFYNAEFANEWNYDPEKAKSLLAEAGYPDGFNCTMLSTAQYGMHQSTAEVCQAYLSMIGVNVTLDLPEWSTRVKKGNEGTYDIAVMGTAAANNDPDGLATVLDGSLSPSYARSYGMETPEISEAFAKGRASFDTEERKAIYKELERVAIETAPIMGLCWREQGYGMAANVSGFSNLPGQLTFHSGFTLEEAMIG